MRVGFGTKKKGVIGGNWGGKDGLEFRLRSEYHDADLFWHASNHLLLSLSFFSLS